MTSPGTQPDVGAVGRPGHQPITQRRPVLLTFLDAWREAADDVEECARRWRAACIDDRADAAAAFFAALEREERAAVAYELVWQS
jgi:hypothetical protein